MRVKKTNKHAYCSENNRDRRAPYPADTYVLANVFRGSPGLGRPRVSTTAARAHQLPGQAKFVWSGVFLSFRFIHFFFFFFHVKFINIIVHRRRFRRRAIFYCVFTDKLSDIGNMIIVLVVVGPPPRETLVSDGGDGRSTTNDYRDVHVHR